jgi:hypothetical protein
MWKFLLLLFDFPSEARASAALGRAHRAQLGGDTTRALAGYREAMQLANRIRNQKKRLTCRYLAVKHIWQITKIVSNPTEIIAHPEELILDLTEIDPDYASFRETCRLIASESPEN